MRISHRRRLTLRMNPYQLSMHIRLRTTYHPMVGRDTDSTINSHTRWQHNDVNSVQNNVESVQTNLSRVQNNVEVISIEITALIMT